MYQHFFCYFIVIFFLFACSNEDNISDIDNPNLVAVAFFEAIYNEKNINKAAAAASPTLSRLLIHYKTSQSVARHLLNMPYEKIITIQPDKTRFKIRERFKDNAIVTVYISGYYDDKIIKNIKQLSLIKNKNNQWIIDELLKDPF